MITCVVHYVIDPEQIDAFERFAREWMRLVARNGGVHHGYFLPAEGASDHAEALFSFESLAAYERYRARFGTDPVGVSRARPARHGATVGMKFAHVQCPQHPPQRPRRTWSTLTRAETVGRGRGARPPRRHGLAKARDGAQGPSLAPPRNARPTTGHRPPYALARYVCFRAGPGRLPGACRPS